MKKAAIVEIKGGLGNQIFQYSFSKHLENMGFRVTYNLDFFKHSKKTSGDTKRDFHLDKLGCDVDEMSRLMKIFSNVLNYLINSKKVKKFFPFINKYIYKYLKEKDFNKNFDYKVYSMINYFDGYWQNNIFHLKNNKESILRRFNIDYQNLESLNNEKVLIHIRRQDYLNLGMNLNINYYKNSIDFLKKELKEFEYDIFTDDKEWVSNQIVFSNCRKIYGEDIDPIKSFNKMLRYKHFIIANSTYSYLAAFFGEKKDTKVLMPYRWGSKKNINFLTNNSWEKIKF